MKQLDLGGIALPIDVLTSTVAVLGIRGSGKTNTAAVIVEEATAIGVPSAVTDPTGAWWGLKSSRDGKRAGLPFYVFGGEHADVPLEPEAGAYLGQFVVDKRVPTICDVSLMRKGRQVHFTTMFLEEVYERNREPLLTVIDEASRFIPQTARREANPDIMRCVGAVEDIGMLGRKRGLGCILVAQRAAMVNKNALAQCHTLVVHQTNAPQDRAAIDDWIGEQHGAGEERTEFLRALPMLRKGEAFIWSPTFGIFARAQIRQRATFDSGATPEIGKRVATATVFASVDLAALSADLAAVKARADENDPKRLHAKIAELQKQIDTARPQHVEVPVLTDEDREQLRRLHAAIEKTLPILTVAVKGAALEQLMDKGELPRVPLNRGAVIEAIPSSVKMVLESTPRRQERPSNGEAQLGEGERKVLAAVAQFMDAGMTREHVAIATGYKRSTRNTYIQRLRQAGYVEERGDRIYPTSEGLAAVGEYEPLPTGASLQRFWLERLPVGEAQVLEHVLAFHPRPVARDEIGELTGFARSTRNTYIQRLASRELVECTRDSVKAADLLFGGARR